MLIIHLTGAAQFAGAIGLLTRRMRAVAAWSLVAMLVGLFPANVYASLNNVTLGGEPPTEIWLRTPLQLF